MLRKRQLFAGTLRIHFFYNSVRLRDENEIDLPTLLTAVGDDCLVD